MEHSCAFLLTLSLILLFLFLPRFWTPAFYSHVAALACVYFRLKRRCKQSFAARCATVLSDEFSGLSVAPQHKHKHRYTDRQTDTRSDPNTHAHTEMDEHTHTHTHTHIHRNGRTNIDRSTHTHVLTVALTGGSTRQIQRADSDGSGRVCDSALRRTCAVQCRQHACRQQRHQR